MYRAVKILGALLLLISLGFPISQSIDQDSWAPTGSYNYALSRDPGDWLEGALWFCLLLFTWPVLMLALLSRFSRGWAALLLRTLELLALLYSYVFVDLLSMFARQETGTHLALCGFAVYALGALWEDAAIFLKWARTTGLLAPIMPHVQARGVDHDAPQHEETQ